MLLSTLDVALRAASAALLLLIAAVLLRDFGGRVAGKLAALFAAGSAAYAVSSGVGFSSEANVFCAALAAIASGNIVVFWLFARAVFDDAFELRPWHVILWAVLCGISLGNCLLPAGTSAWPTHIFGPGLGILSLVFIALAIAQTIETWSDDLVEGRRQVRAFVVTAAAGFGALNAAVQLLSPGGRPSSAWRSRRSCWLWWRRSRWR